MIATTYTVEELMKKWRCSAHRVYRRIKCGAIQPIEALGKPYQFDRKYIDGLGEQRATKRSLKLELAGRVTSRKPKLSSVKKQKEKKGLWER